MGKDLNTDMECVSQWLKFCIKQFHSLHSEERLCRRGGAEDSVGRAAAPQTGFRQQATATASAPSGVGAARFPVVELLWGIPRSSQLILKVLVSEGITGQPLLSFLHPLNDLLSTDVEILVAGVSTLIDDFRAHLATGIQEKDPWDITPIRTEIFILGFLFILQIYHNKIMGQF